MGSFVFFQFGIGPGAGQKEIKLLTKGSLPRYGGEKTWEQSDEQVHEHLPNSLG